jgi:hypothetical protein
MFDLRRSKAYLQRGLELRIVALSKVERHVERKRQSQPGEHNSQPRLAIAAALNPHDYLTNNRVEACI